MNVIMFNVHKQKKKEESGFGGKTINHFLYDSYIGRFKMIVDKYGNYVRKFMWQLCG
jgi:hypothetical protein